MRKIEPIFIVILIGLVVIGSALINIFINNGHNKMNQDEHKLQVAICKYLDLCGYEFLLFQMVALETSKWPQN